ncbi:MAG: flavin reductase family protein [Chakrabartia sp.]
MTHTTDLAPHDPALGDAFRQAMRNVASAVYLITASGPEGDVGMTATAACSLSFDPFSVLICVNRSASMFRTLEATGRFVLNVLSAGDAPIASAFGSPAGRDERFGNGDWYQLDNMPALRSSLASISCTIADTKDFGTHRIFVGQVDQVENREGLAELLYCQGAFRQLAPAG